MALPNPGIEPGSPALQVGSLPTELSGTPYSGINAWEIPRTEEPGVLQSMGSQGGGHDLATKQQTGFTISCN